MVNPSIWDRIQSLLSYLHDTILVFVKTNNKGIYNIRVYTHIYRRERERGIFFSPTADWKKVLHNV